MCRQGFPWQTDICDCKRQALWGKGGVQAGLLMMRSRLKRSDGSFTRQGSNRDIPGKKQGSVQGIDGTSLGECKPTLHDSPFPGLCLALLGACHSLTALASPCPAA